MHKYAPNMIYAKICSDSISISPMHSYAMYYAFICTKYAICKINKHEIYATYAKICTPHFADDTSKLEPKRSFSSFRR